MSVFSSTHSSHILRAALLLALGPVGALGAANCSYAVWNIIQDSRHNTAAMNNVEAPSWVRESEMRGTFSILQSCVLTLLACVYSALHLNVPERSDFWSVVLLKTQWSLTALVAPESVLGIAMLQFIQAWRLRNNLRSLKRSNESKIKINLNYAFFVVMGGLQVRVDALANEETLKRLGMSESWKEYFRKRFNLGVDGRRYDPGNAVLQLTPYGVEQLAADHWEDVFVAEKKILDKSKANPFQKILVLIQMSWMMAVCIVRKVNGLPLTILEIHTMVHVICALVIFSLWFYVRQDIHTNYCTDILTRLMHTETT